ncbi:hypothetical protein KDC22_32010 [Paenibacillus tritici]|uniref:hypothetical protein n=1 Tax=Paenibacillus tritici TaxID=1873425 RepID=UPI001BAB468A|nr:hypothetical protein [Paenibacillus tritici]QUL54816.1 hypothetical protein KDC22_32010 [Paenibacillus tritici]
MLLRSASKAKRGRNMLMSSAALKASRGTEHVDEKRRSDGEAGSGIRWISSTC